MSERPEATVPYHPSQANSSDPLPRVPGYEELEWLSDGGMGVVYRARQVSARRTVVLKMIRAGVLASPSERQRFRFEAEAIVALDHPGIVPVYDVGEADSQPYLCLKYCEQGSLAARLQAGHRYGLTEAAELVAEIALAVQHAHDRGVLHRDLKPGNILLDVAGRPQVADFGLARRIGHDGGLTQTGSPLGTIGYMPPEQAGGLKDVTVHADVFALGAVLYELLTGQPPVQTLAQTLSPDPISGPRALNHDVPADLDAVCLKCLAKDPRLRYASATELAQDLQRFLRGEPVSIQPPGALEWLMHTLRTRPPPSPEYTWQESLWVGAIVCVQHLGVFAVVWMDWPTSALWAVMAAGWLAWALSIWVVELPRFHLFPTTERHSLVAGLAFLVGHAVLFLATGPPWSEPARTVLGLYPAYFVLAGVVYAILASTHWGRLLPVGLALIGLAPVAAAWPILGPPLFAVAIGTLQVWWGLTTWWAFVRPGRQVDFSSKGPLG